MGQFINVGNARFRRALDSKYVDKTQLIAAVNSTLFKEWNMSCVTRCRRFGKSMAASMLCAYYDKSCDSRELFKGLSIAKDPSFEKHLNKYPVIFIDMSIIISRFGHDADIVDKMQKEISNELLEVYPEVKMRDEDDLMDLILRIANHTGEPFLMIIDEWDAICREFKKSEAPMDKYITLLRRFFKGSNAPQAFIGAYITGIHALKEYNDLLIPNNFWEYTEDQMLNLKPTTQKPRSIHA
ncbi:MAG: AAA family ATPase [Bacteroidales bacterium]|nr:AAA family ATPase [Bacteroidales bacterium]